MQNEIELAPRSIRRKYVSIQQYCDYLRMVLNLNEIFFRFTARKFQLPRTLPRTLSREEIKELILAATFQYQQAWSEYKERLAVRNMCIIELLFCLGLRVGELSALDMADYWPEENTVLIRGQGRIVIKRYLLEMILRVWYWEVVGKRKILMRSDTKLPQPFASWSNSL